MRSNNSHDVIASGQVTSLAMPFWTAPGFAVPLIQSRGDSNATYVQRVNGARNIIGFDMFQGDARIIPLKDEQIARIGHKEVFALIDPEGVAHAGTQKELSPIVRDWVGRINEPLLRMTFARFCGEDHIARTSAREVVDQKSSEFKSREEAILWFINSVILVELVDSLVTAKDSSRDISSAVFEETLIFANITNRRLDIELPESLLARWSKNGKRQSARLKKITEFLHFATNLDVDLKKRSASDGARSSDYQIRERAEQLRDKIGSLGRQESRLSLLIKITLEDPQVGRRLWDGSLENTAFLKMAIGKLRENVNLERPDLAAEIASVLPGIISGAFPRERGRLLLELARTLNKHPQINSIVRQATLKSNSMDIVPLREEILKNLK